MNKQLRKIIMIGVAIPIALLLAFVIYNYLSIQIWFGSNNNNNHATNQNSKISQLTGHYEGLALYRDTGTGKVGFINEEGKIAIQPIYEHGLFFENGVAIVKYKNGWGIINTTGDWVFGPNKKFDEVYKYLNPEIKLENEQ